MKKYLLASAAILAGMGSVSHSRAQSSGPSAAPSNVTGKLEEITVTAQKRSENIQRTAIPITAVSGTQLKAEAKNQIDAILKDVPSVQIQSAPQGADIVIRGVGGNDVGGIQQDPDVSVMEDSVYTGQAASTLGSAFDINRIEVLRGPQGTLYGRNAAGGALNVLSNDPVNRYSGGLNVNFANYGGKHVDGYVNIPVTDSLQIRIAGVREGQEDGFYTNGGGQFDNAGARVKVKWTPTNDITLVLRGEYTQQQSYITSTPNPIASTASSCSAPLNGPGPPCILFAPVNPGNPYDTSVAAFSPFQTAPVYNNNIAYTYSAQLDYDLGFGVVTLIPSMTRFSQIQSSASLFAPSAPPFLSSTTKDDQYTGEARIASPASSAFKWVAGVYVLSSNANQSGTTAGSTGTTFYAQQTDNERPASSVAGFAQGTYPVLPGLRLTLGGRYNVDSKSILYGICSSNDGIHCNGIYTSPASNLNSKYSSFTFRGGVEYDVAPSAMAYAQISSGYKAGGYSTADFPPVAYQPEKLIDYELGLKSRWLDNTLQFNADAFIYQYTNQQIELHVTQNADDLFPAQYQYLIPPNTFNSVIRDVNAGNSRYEGIEEQARYQVTRHDQISLDVAYEHATYGNFVIDTTGGPPGTGYTQQYFDLTGKQEAHAPKLNGSARYQHQFDLPTGTLTFLGDMHFQSGSFATIQEWFANGHTRENGFEQTDLYLNYAHNDGRLRFGLFVKNVENRATVSSIYPLYKETLNAPRTYGFSASYAY